MKNVPARSQQGIAGGQDEMLELEAGDAELIHRIEHDVIEKAVPFNGFLDPFDRRADGRQIYLRRSEDGLERLVADDVVTVALQSPAVVAVAFAEVEASALLFTEPITRSS
jgi:hypothetical protein